MQGLHDKIESVCTYLAAVKGQACNGQAWKAQHGQLETCIRNANITITDATSIVNALKKLPEPDRLIQAVMESLSDGRPEISALAQRKGLQNYVALPDYFTAKQWMTFANADVSARLKLDMFMEHLARLGLCCPSESTVQAIGAFYLMAIESEETRNNMTPAMKLETAKSMKKKLKEHSAGAACLALTRICHVEKLPGQPLELQRSQPQFWALAFQDDRPIASMIADAEFMRTQASIPMRISRSDAKSTASLQTVTPHLQFGLGSERAAGIIMQSMQALMQQNQQLVQAFSFAGGRGSSPLQLQIGAAQESSPAGLRVLNRLNSRLALENSECPCSVIQQEPASSAALLPPTQLLVAAPAASQAAVPEESTTQARTPKTVQETTAAMLKSMQQKSAANKAAKDTKPTTKDKKADSKKADGKKADKQKAKTSAKNKQTKKAAQKKTEKARPFGCSKCRGTAGCTASCLKSNTRPLEKPYDQVKKQKF